MKAVIFFSVLSVHGIVIYLKQHKLPAVLVASIRRTAKQKINNTDKDCLLKTNV